MDSYEATKIVFSRIQTLDSENASKIMGYLLIQDQGEKEMIRLAFGPETLLHNLIGNAKTQLGLPPHSKTSTTPSFNPISRPNPLSLSSSPSSNLWSLSNPVSPSSTCSPSYANIVSKSSNLSSGSLSSSINDSSSASELVDTFQFSFLNDPKTDDEFFDGNPEGVYSNSSVNKQSYSGHCACAFGSEDVNSGLGWKPCTYFARGFCKNGSSCRFLHSDGLPGNVNMLEQCEDLLRSNAAAQQHKLAAVSQFMSNGASLPYNKCLNLLMQQQNDTQRSLMMGDELHKFGRYQHERSDISSLGGNVIPSSRQIYLTFPADSTFREEDVSNYFNMFGPVQDVRIPYQQKRMFGFVTFVYSETVKIILAKGNPHFVCDSRVLVKPYKEKGKIPDKKLNLHLERGDYSLSSSLSGLESREPCDFNLGSRMFYSTHEMLLRRKLENQANLEQALELQERRLMNMQFLGIKNDSHHQHQYYQGLAEGSPFPSPTLPYTPKNQPLIVLPNGNADVSEEAEQQEQKSGKDQSSAEECDLLESMEHILPDNLFASPAAAGDNINVFSTASAQVNESTPISSSSNSNSNSNNDSNLLPTTSTSSSTSNATSPKSVLSSPGFLLGMEPLECN